MTYCDFRPGDEVVCIVSAWRTWGEDAATVFPEVGRVYTVDGLCDDAEGVWLVLVELPDHCYAPSRFRKVERKTDSLSIESFLTIKPGYEEPRRTKAPAKRERA